MSPSSQGKAQCLHSHWSPHAATSSTEFLHGLNFCFRWNSTRRKILTLSALSSLFFSGWPVFWLIYPARKLLEMCTALWTVTSLFCLQHIYNSVLHVLMHKIQLKKKKWLLLKPDFLIVVSGIHEKVVKSDIALSRPWSRLLSPLRWLLMLVPHGGEEGHVQGGRVSTASQKGGPSWGWTGWPLGWEHFLRNLTSTYPLYHYEIYNLKKKKVEMPSPFEGKRVLLLNKAASLCFDTPVFELLSLASRVSDIPAVGHSECGQRSREAPLPCEKSKLSVYGWLCKAQRRRTSSALGFISALYWRQTFANKEKKKKKMFWEKPLTRVLLKFLAY